MSLIDWAMVVWIVPASAFAGMPVVASSSSLRGRLGCGRVVVCLLLLVLILTPALARGGGTTSKTIAAVLREPLPPEELRLTSTRSEWVITGPTFRYHVRKGTGVITSLHVQTDGRELIGACSPADIELDDCSLALDLMSSQVQVLTQTTHQVVLRIDGTLRARDQGRPEVDCTLLHTFFDDGVLVTTVKLRARQDLPVRRALLCGLHANGEFTHYLHKRRDEHGESAARGPLPEAGKAIRFSTLTSCLQVFSPSATLALFTDCGATFLSRTNLDTAVVEVTNKEHQRAGVRLCQYLLQVAPGDQPFVLKAGEDFSFRVGISVAPNRIAPPRLHDLRMFAWVGDAKFPYPTDQEIEVVAQNGYTLFQMHRLGTPGEPRPPAGELERVINKVHELGMLFLWTENADLMYDSAPGVQALKARGQFSLWQGFNYGGSYKASMDPYCDLVSTCLASPNGLAEYRLATLQRMLERFAVDGIYLDDNLAYPGCTLWREHGHPRPVYDCLIELHEMNWKRRQLLRSKCPHLVLASHNTRAIILPVLCDFDAVLYGEGYSFDSLENYWSYYRPVNGQPAQGMIWCGGQDPARCPASVAYNFDLLTGGGQYCYIDWRLFPKKFPYAAGVTPTEQLYVQTYNLAQYWFGLYESKPYYFADSAALFATSTPLTYATIYRNQVWGDWLIVLANMGQKRQQTAVELRALRELGLKPRGDYVLFNIQKRTARSLKGSALREALQAISVPAQGLELLCLRQLPVQGAYHLWGGKRIAEEWDRKKSKLTLSIQGPAGLEETLFLGCVKLGVERVLVDGKPQPFFFDQAQGLIHGKVKFASQPLKVECLCSPNGIHALPQGPVAASPLATELSVVR